jgi:hypothetical protein
MDGSDGAGKRAAMSQYIIDIVFSVIDCTCKIVLTNAPENPVADKMLLFSNVGNISVSWYHEPDGDTLSDFNGITDHCVDEKRSEFSFNTGDCIVKFEACTEYETAAM